MLPLETKQSGGKTLPHSDLRGGSVSRRSITQQEKGLFLGIWNVRSLYRAGSLTAAARELARYKLDLVGVQEVRWDKGGTVRARMGEGRSVHRVLMGKPEGKRPLGRPRRRWEDNIKMDLQEVGGGGDWMELAQDRDGWRALVNTVMN